MQTQPTTKLNAADFRHCIGRVDMAITSLQSCRSHEVANEARILTRALNDLCAAELARKNDRLLADRAKMIRWATDLLARRLPQAA